MSWSSVRLVLMLACAGINTTNADLWTGRYSEQSPRGSSVDSGFSWNSQEIAKNDESFLFEPKGVARSTRDCGTVDPANSARQFRPGTNFEIGDIRMRMAAKRASSGLTFHQRWVAETASCFVDPSCANWQVTGRSRFAKNITVTHLALDGEPLHAYTFTDCIPTEHNISPEPFCVSAAESATKVARCFEVEEVTLQCDGFKIERLPRTPSPPVAVNDAIGTPAADLSTLKQRGPTTASVRQRATALGPNLCICVTEPCPCDNPILLLHAAGAATAAGALAQLKEGGAMFDLPDGGCVCVTDPCPCAGGPIISLAQDALAAAGGCICCTDPCPCALPFITVHVARIPPNFCICVTEPCPCTNPFLELLPPSAVREEGGRHTPFHNKYRPSHLRPLPSTDPAANLLASTALFLAPGGGKWCVCVTDPCPCDNVAVWLSPSAFVGVDNAVLTADLTAGGCICITSPCQCAWPLLQLNKTQGVLAKQFPEGCICVTEPCPCDDVVIWINPARALPSGCICFTDPCPCDDVFSIPRNVLRVAGGGMVVVPAATPAAIEARAVKMKIVDHYVWTQGHDQRKMQTEFGAGAGGHVDDVDIVSARQGSSTPSEFFFSPAAHSAASSSKARDVLSCPNNATGGHGFVAAEGTGERAADGVPGFVWWRPLLLTYDFTERYGVAQARRAEKGPFKYRLLPLDLAPPLELMPEEDVVLHIRRTSAGGGKGGMKGGGCLSNFELNVAAGSGSGSACGSGSGGMAARFGNSSSYSACFHSDGTPASAWDMYNAGLAMNLMVAHTDPETKKSMVTVCEGAFMSSLSLPRLSFFNSLVKTDPRRLARGSDEDVRQTASMVCGKTDHF